MHSYKKKNLISFLFTILISLLFFSNIYAQDCAGKWILNIETNATTVTSSTDEDLTLPVTKETKVIDCGGDLVPWPLPIELHQDTVDIFCTKIITIEGEESVNVKEIHLLGN